MNKLFLKMLLPIVLITLIYKWRYRLLNIILGIQSIRKWSVRLAMMFPSVRSRMISNVFRSE